MRIGLSFHCCDRCISGVGCYALGLLRGLAGIDRENEYLARTNQPVLARDNVPPVANMTVVFVGHARTRMAHRNGTQTHRTRGRLGRGGLDWVRGPGRPPSCLPDGGCLRLPSLYAGFGFAPLEAMACGTPVVSSSRGALAETAAEAALVVDPEDLQQITAGVIAMTTDSHASAKHIEMGLRQSRMFAWRKAADAILSIYKEAADTHGD